MNIYDVLKEKEITLPAPPPKGGVYTPVQEFGTNLLYCSGCGPLWKRKHCCRKARKRPDIGRGTESRLQLHAEPSR